MAKQHTSKQSKIRVKFDTGEVKEPPRTGERQPRRHYQRARSRTVTTPINGADPVLATGQANAEKNAAPTTNDDMPASDASPFEPESAGSDAATASASGADQPPVSTKHAMLIAMLEPAQGASVAEIGQRLGWLPHTVRAAITGLRHAGREVTRNKDKSGQSVYRLAPAETPDR